MKKRLVAMGAFFFLMALMLIPGFVVAQDSQAQEDDEDTESKNKQYVAAGAVIAMSMAGIISAIALGLTGSAAVGVISEKEELFGKALILQVLPMTQGIYGLVAAILLLRGAGFVGGGGADLTDDTVGIVALTVSLVVGLTAVSAIPQAQTSSAGISALPRNPGSSGKSIILAAMPETMAVFGLLIGILLMKGVGLL